MPEGTESSTTEGTENKEATFTQADLDRVVADRLKREREAIKVKYADYDDLKQKAEGAKTLEDRLAEVEKTAAQSSARALRAEIANTHGISAEDRDLFLTGTDAETLTAQAKRLADRTAEANKAGNHVPREGETKKPPVTDERAFAKALFGTGD